MISISNRCRSIVRRTRMAKIPDPWHHHDWDSKDYVAEWAERQKGREPDRQEAFAALAAALPYKKDAAIKILDVGAGYGGLAMYLLARFPNATALCQDGSQAMSDLGSERMKPFKGRSEEHTSELQSRFG